MILLRREPLKLRRQPLSTVLASAFCGASALALGASVFIVAEGLSERTAIVASEAEPLALVVASQPEASTAEQLRGAMGSAASAKSTFDADVAASEVVAFVPEVVVPTDWREQAEAAAIEAEAVLASHTDAKLALEQHLVNAITTLRNIEEKHFFDAVLAVEAARDAVVADAENFRAWVADEAAGSWQTGANVDAQLAYMRQYATEYNTAEFGDFNASGGDCANFVSQGLLARGWAMDDAWASFGRSDATSAWVYVPALDNYLSSLGIPSSGLDNLDRLRVGDVGIFDWGEDGSGRDHTMTVSRIDYTDDGPIVYFASHNTDGAERELMYSLYEEHSDSTAWFYHLPG